MSVVKLERIEYATKKLTLLHNVGDSKQRSVEILLGVLLLDSLYDLVVGHLMRGLCQHGVDLIWLFVHLLDFQRA